MNGEAWGKKLAPLLLREEINVAGPWRQLETTHNGGYSWKPGGPHLLPPPPGCTWAPSKANSVTGVHSLLPKTLSPHCPSPLFWDASLGGFQSCTSPHR